jgi:hypothetical protein
MVSHITDLLLETISIYPGRLVAQIKEGLLVPDFTVDRYYGAAMRDRICIVIEIASKGRHDRLKQKESKVVFQEKVEAQLMTYIRHAHRKNGSVGQVLGVALLGNRVWMAEVSGARGDERVRPLTDNQWISMFDGRFVAELNNVLDQEDFSEMSNDEACQPNDKSADDSDDFDEDFDL